MSRLTWALAFSMAAVAASALLAADAPEGERVAELAAPVRVMAGGEAIDVAGHAAPFVGDFDGDGKVDLLVGQMGQGRLRIYRNTGTSAKVKFDRFTWFQAGGRTACVPTG